MPTAPKCFIAWYKRSLHPTEARGLFSLRGTGQAATVQSLWAHSIDEDFSMTDSTYRGSTFHIMMNKSSTIPPTLCSGDASSHLIVCCLLGVSVLLNSLGTDNATKAKPKTAWFAQTQASGVTLLIHPHIGRRLSDSNRTRLSISTLSSE